jgi:hypothetical protein
MEGTPMVACVSGTTLPFHSPRAADGPPDHAPPQSVKLLDLLTNRYHVGIVRGNSAAGMQVEFPASAHLQAGQRVHFAMSGDQPLIARRAMMRGFITRVAPSHTGAARVHLQPAPLPETAVA